MTVMAPIRARLLVVCAAIAAASCSFGNVQCGFGGDRSTGQAQAPQPSDPAARTGPTETPTVEVVFLGDSLTAGLGLLSNQAYPALLEEKFAADGYSIEAVNAGVSGDTTAGGRRRVEGLIGPSTKIVVVALGGNDALRGLTVAETHDNLAAIISAILARQAGVLLCGMEAPTNLGEDYRSGFRDIFIQLTREFRGRIHVLPFLLEGVAGVPALNQADGIHPNAQGAQAVADLVYPRLRAMIDSMG
jgi:acyl-CoA thioesterase-1